MIMKNLLYFCREALKSMARNRVLSIATISTVAVCILILGMTVLGTLNASRFMRQLESDIEIMAYLNKDLTESQIKDVKKDLTGIPGVQEVVFVSKDEALQTLQESFGKDQYNLKQTLGKNPLPDAFDIKAADPHQVPDIAAQAEKVYGITKVNYGKEMVTSLFTATRWIRILGMVFMALLSLGAIFLIATTIRLAIFARRKEIYLMKLIGSTDWFIRWPFFIEGILLGAMGALIAILFLAPAYGSLIGNVQTVAFMPLVTNHALLTQLFASLVLVGACLGVLGTFISINRFLDV